MLNMLGSVGMSNAGALYAEDSDCSECGGWCYTWDFTIENGNFTAFNTGQSWGEWVSGVGWKSLFVIANNTQSLAILRAFDESTVTQFEFIATFTSPGTDAGNTAVIRNNGSNVALNTNAIYASGTYGVGVGGSEYTSDEVMANPAIGNTSGGEIVITSATIRGVGINPFGVDNCI